MKNLKWSKEEVALLIELYMKIYRDSFKDSQCLIEQLSEELIQRGKNKGVKLDCSYRNILGIKMKLQNIRFIDTEGLHGLSGYSKLDVEMYNMYKNDPLLFQECLK